MSLLLIENPEYIPVVFQLLLIPSPRYYMCIQANTERYSCSTPCDANSSHLVAFHLMVFWRSFHTRTLRASQESIVCTHIQVASSLCCYKECCTRSVCTPSFHVCVCSGVDRLWPGWLQRPRSLSANPHPYTTLVQFGKILFYHQPENVCNKCVQPDVVLV